jgi:hypothetical protein
VCVLQRFGSSLNLNPHFHALVLEGVYASPSPFVPPTFHELDSPTDEELAEVLEAIRRRILHHLRARGLLDSESGRLGPADSAEEPPLLALFDAASIRGQAAFAPPGTPSPLHWGLAPTPSPRGRSAPPPALCVHQDGFSMHAAVLVPADDRTRLEHLARYLLRPPIASERLSLDERGRIQLRLRKAFRDGTTHLIFNPLEFIARLASLVPRPRTHLVTYHGVLAPASSWRDDVVPADNPGPIPPSHSLSGSTPVQNASNPSPSTPPAPHRIPWAELLRRVFAVDALRCTHCSGRRRVIAVIQDPVPVRAILRHLGLDPKPIAIAPARSPPELAFPA